MIFYEPYRNKAVILTLSKQSKSVNRLFNTLITDSKYKIEGNHKLEIDNTNDQSINILSYLCDTTLSHHKISRISFNRLNSEQLNELERKYSNVSSSNNNDNRKVRNSKVSTSGIVQYDIDNAKDNKKREIRKDQKRHYIKL